MNSEEKKKMSGRRIKALILLQGTTITAIAREAGVSREWVSNIINGHKRSPRIQKAIARALGKKVEDLWPAENKAAQ